MEEGAVAVAARVGEVAARVGEAHLGRPQRLPAIFRRERNQRLTATVEVPSQPSPQESLRGGLKVAEPELMSLETGSSAIFWSSYP